MRTQDEVMFVRADPAECRTAPRVHVWSGGRTAHDWAQQAPHRWTDWKSPVTHQPYTIQRMTLDDFMARPCTMCLEAINGTAMHGNV